MIGTILMMRNAKERKERQQSSYEYGKPDLITNNTTKCVENNTLRLYDDWQTNENIYICFCRQKRQVGI